MGELGRCALYTAAISMGLQMKDTGYNVGSEFLETLKPLGAETA